MTTLFRGGVAQGPARRIAIRTLISPVAGAVVWTLFELPSGKARIDRFNAASGHCSSETGRLVEIMGWAVPHDEVTHDTGWVNL